MVEEAGKAPSLLHRSPSPIETIIRAVEKRRWIALLLGLGSFAVIAVVDLLTPEEISFALFYFIPVGLLAAFLGGPWPWLAAAAGAFLWPVHHLVRGEMAYLGTTVAWWESSVRLGCYAAWIICLRLIRRYVDRQRQADRDLRGALAAVQESEGRYREVFEHSSNGILILDVLPGPRFRVAALNPEVERMTGIRAAQAIGRFVEELLKPSTAEMLTANYRQAVLQNAELEVAVTAELPSGRKDVRTTIIPLAGVDGRVSRLIALPTDVTEQNRVEAAMRESQQRYREVFENTSDGIFVLDVTPDRRFRVAAYNPTMERMTGFRNEEVAGRLNEEFLPPHTAAAVRASNERCLAAGAPISVDEELDLPRGHFWWHTTLVPVRGAGGEILRLIGVSSDVTETVRYQRALRQSEEKFSRAFHASPDSITLTRLSDGVLLEVNQGFLEAYGYERGEVIGRSSLPGVLGIWADAADRQRLTDQLREKGEVTGFEARMRRKGGEIRYCVLSSRVVEIGDEKCILTISRDVTERRRMVEALRESEARYREVFENTSDGIFVLQVMPDRRLRLLSRNPAQQRMIGVSQEDGVGRDVQEYLPAEVADTLGTHSRQCLESGAPVSFEGSFRDGAFCYACTLVPVRDEGGVVARIVGVTQDTTERVRLQQRQREHEQQLFQAAKLSSLGTLVSGVAHEINNPNNFIRLNSQNLAELWKDIRAALEQAPDGPDGPATLHGLPVATVLGMIDDLLAGVEAGSQRIEKLVRSLRDFARGDEGSLSEEVDVNAALDSAVLIVGNAIRKATDAFALHKGEGLPRVRGSAQQVEQVIINLVTNACQALPSRDRAVSVATRLLDGGSWIEIEVADEGVGIPAENLARITDPFFTTKRGSGGSGLGLAVSSRIVSNHRGQMSFHPGPGGGTRAVVKLPAITATS